MHRDEGVGLLGTFSGLAVFMVLLFFAVHLLLGLYVRSAVTAAAYDAARIVATEQGSALDAEAHVRQIVGGVAEGLTVQVVPGGDVVVVRVRATSPQLLPRMMARVGIETTTRDIHIRREEFVE